MIVIALASICAKSDVAGAYIIVSRAGNLLNSNAKGAFRRCHRGSTRSFQTSVDTLFEGGRYTQLEPGTATRGYNGERSMSEVLRLAEEAALKAGEIMKRTAGKIAVSKTKSNSADLVTESDLECQRVIKEVITGAFPDDRFLGEEDVEAGSDASASALRESLFGTKEALGDDDALMWVVDPIDGTTNFQAGLPMYCASIGVVSVSDAKAEVVAGVIYNPALDEMVSAVRGRGCYLNGERLMPDPQRQKGIQLKKALINVGFPVVKESTLRASARAVAALAPKVRGLRMIASASQVMSWVAQSKFHAYISWDLNSWDVAAGMVVVEESGGKVFNFDGTVADITSRDLIVTCSEGDEELLQEQMRLVLEENDCFSYE